MAQALSLQLQEAIDTELPHLNALPEEAASQNDGRPGSWTHKQELGHLIDSATNNHVRFILASVDGEFRGQGYAQDKWVEAHGYQGIEWRVLVDLWHRYNSLLVRVIERIPDEHLQNRCVIGWGVQTLGFIIEDYILHMLHHIDHLLARTEIRPYPGQTKRA